MVFADIITTGNFIIAKNYYGNAFLPEWNLMVLQYNRSRVST